MKVHLTLFSLRYNNSQSHNLLIMLHYGLFLCYAAAAVGFVGQFRVIRELKVDIGGESTKAIRKNWSVVVLLYLQFDVVLVLYTVAT